MQTRRGHFFFLPGALQKAAGSLCKVPRRVAFAAAKTWANAWTTSYRLHIDVKVCLFGCGHQYPDKLEHYRSCSNLWKHIFANWRPRRPYPAGQLGLLRVAGCEQDALASLYVALCMYNSARHTQ